MKALAICIVLACCASAQAQSNYIQKRDAAAQKRLEERNRLNQQKAEALKFQREYEMFVRTGVLPTDKDRAALLLKSHELRLKQMELQAKMAEKAPKGRWEVRIDGLSGRPYQYFQTEEEARREVVKQPPRMTTGTIGGKDVMLHSW